MDFLQLLPRLLLGALALVMFGLGLSLSLDDFRRLARHPKAVLIALGLQVVLLPLACFAIARALGLSPVFAVGLMLLAASPGGISANLFSHLFGGNVAMNISLMAINTVLSIVTLPLVVNLSLAYFLSDQGHAVSLQWQKVVEVVAVVIVPVALGMLVGARRPALARRAKKAIQAVQRPGAAGVCADRHRQGIDRLGGGPGHHRPAVVVFNLVSLGAGYFLSRAAGLDKPMATAICYEIGIHNSTLALYIALSLLNNFEMALPAALYSIVMYITATLFGFTVLRRQAAKGGYQ